MQCCAWLCCIGSARSSPVPDDAGAAAGRIFIEQPDPREEGAGVQRLRREIGPIGRYLREVFPDRTVRQLAELPNHRESPYPRELWLVEEPAGWPTEPAEGLDVAALVDLQPCWPPRSWWQSQIAALPHSPAERGSLAFTAEGLPWTSGAAAGISLGKLRRQLQTVPEHTALTHRQFWTRRARRMAGGMLRGLGMRR